jgi:hypothetical protein
VGRQNVHRAHRQTRPAAHPARGRVPDRHRGRQVRARRRPLPRRQGRRTDHRHQLRAAREVRLADFGGVVCDESSAIKSFDGVRRAASPSSCAASRTGSSAPPPPHPTTTSSSAHQRGARRPRPHGHAHPVLRQRRPIRRRPAAAPPAGRRSTGDSRATPRPRSGGGCRPGPARCAARPTTAFDDGPFVLPELLERTTVVDRTHPRDDSCSTSPPSASRGARGEPPHPHRALRGRGRQLLDDAEPAVAWCHLNAESELLTRIIPGAVEVSGSDDPDEKEEKLAAFTRGEIRVLVTKPSIGAWGLNWQHCHRMTYFPVPLLRADVPGVRRSGASARSTPSPSTSSPAKAGEHPRQPAAQGRPRPTPCSPPSSST